MAINDVAGGRVWDILRAFLDRNFVSGLRILKPKKTKKIKDLKTLSKKPRFFPALVGPWTSLRKLGLKWSLISRTAVSLVNCWSKHWWFYW